LETTADDGKNYHTRDYNLDAYLDLAENRAERGILMQMDDWVGFLNSFLELSNYPILQHKGKVRALAAKLKAEGEFEAYRKRQDAKFATCARKS